MSTVHNARFADHKVASRDEWIRARRELLAKEKEFTRLRDQLGRERRELPWMKVEKEYVFDGPGGKVTLADLFKNRSQLFVYHFMFAPDWDEGCAHCSFWADHFDGPGIHLNHRDVTFVAVSRAPISKIEAFKKRMGWKFHWVSSGETDFNYDFFVSFTPEEVANGTAFYNFETHDVGTSDREGASAFFKDDSGSIFHTYTTQMRGIDLMNGTYNILDMVAKGRDEDGLEFVQEWVRYHDRYED
ncbi:MAG: DUF899 domain-containing protein [Capsulimonadaceae bacterium]